MLTEEARAEITDAFYDNIDYSYNDFTPTARVWRMGEGFSKEDLPIVLIKFLPTSIRKFESVSDVIGWATEDKRYYNYGYCQVENCSVHCYSGAFHDDKALNGRLYASHLANEALKVILTGKLDTVLAKYGARRERDHNLTVKDASAFHREMQSHLYEYDVDFDVRTSLVWNRVPPEYEDGENYVKKMGLYFKSTNDEYTYKLIKIES